MADGSLQGRLRRWRRTLTLHHCERGYQLFVYLHSADTPKFIRILIDFSWQFDQWPGEMVDFADYVIGYRGMLVRLVDDPWEQYSFIEVMDVEGPAL